MSGLLCTAFLVRAQQPDSGAGQKLVESGNVSVNGRSVPYRIHRLPVSSFPELPSQVAGLLDQRGCMIPQTYEARRPENVVHASLERAGSSDWAVLCSAGGSVSLLVFFGSSTSSPVQLAATPETQRLQAHDSTGVLGFNWGIDPATAQTVREAEVNLEPHPPLLDHDGLADSIIDHRTVYRIYTRKGWTSVAVDD